MLFWKLEVLKQNLFFCCCLFLLFFKKVKQNDTKKEANTEPGWGQSVHMDLGNTLRAHGTDLARLP